MAGAAVQREFYAAVCELRDGSKPQINFLTMLAEDHVRDAAAVVRAIESRLEATRGQNVQYLFLIDSIVKNVKGSAYRSAFQDNIVKSFMDVYAHGNPAVRKTAMHVRNTWREWFSPRALASLDAAVRQLDGGQPQQPYQPAHRSPRGDPRGGPRGDSRAHRSPHGANYPGGPHSFGGPQRAAAPQHHAPPPQSRQAQQEALFQAEDKLRHGGLNPTQRQELIAAAEGLRQQLGMPPAGSGGPGRAPRPRGPSADPRRGQMRRPDHMQTDPRHGAYPQGAAMAGGAGFHPRQPGPQHQRAGPPSGGGGGSSAAELLAKIQSTGLLDLLGGVATNRPPHPSHAPAHGQPRQPLQQHDGRPRDGREPMVVKLTFRDLHKRDARVVDVLYKDLALQCRECGRRFHQSDKRLYDDHLDWHFRLNLKRAASQFRGWYFSTDDWVQFAGVDAIEERSKSAVFDAGPGGAAEEPQEEEQPDEPSTVLQSAAPSSSCVKCHEKFESRFDDDEEEWIYEDAKLVDGNLYHVRCYRDAAENDTLSSPVADNKFAFDGQPPAVPAPAPADEAGPAAAVPAAAVPAAAPTAPEAGAEDGRVSEKRKLSAVVGEEPMLSIEKKPRRI